MWTGEEDVEVCVGKVYKLGEGEKVAEAGARGIWERREGEGWIKKLEELRKGRQEGGIKEGVDEERMKREKNAAEMKVQGCECVCVLSEWIE